MYYFDIISYILEKNGINKDDVSNSLNIERTAYDKWFAGRNKTKSKGISRNYTPQDFYDRVFNGLLFEVKQKSADIVAIDLIRALDNKNIFPLDWEKDRKLLLEKELFNLEQFESFVLTLLSRKENITVRQPSPSQALNKNEPVYYNKCIKNIFPQSLNILNTKESLDFPYYLLNQENTSRLLIFGPGGQGKTTLLNNLDFSSKESEKYEHVFKLSLASLLPNSIVWSQQNSQITPNNLIQQKINTLLNGAIYSNQRILLLLDGYNELLSSCNLNFIKSIKAEIAYLNENWKNTDIIVTSRPLPLCANNTPLHEELRNYTVCTLSGVPESEYQEFLKNNPNLSDEMKHLIKTPMYFHLMKTTQPLPDSQYDLFRLAYKRLWKQINSDTETNNYSLAYYVILPFIARIMSENNSMSMREDIIRTKINDLLIKKNYLSALFSTVINAQELDLIFTDYNANTEQLISNIKNIGLLTFDAGNYTLHEDWRDFLTAFSYVSEIQTLIVHHEEKNIIAETNINLNVSASVSRLIKQAFMLYEKTDDIASNYERLFAGAHNGFYANKIEGTIKKLHTAFQFIEYLQFGSDAKSLAKKLHNIIHDTDENFFFTLTNYVRLNPGVLSEITVNETLDLISKECEYYRDERDYNSIFNLVELSRQLSSDHNDPIGNQEGKAYLYQVQDNLTGLRSDESSIDNLWNNGIVSLKTCAENGFNLSANSYGMILSTPAPFLIKNNITDINSVQAFTIYYNSYNKMISSRTRYIGRELAYTVRQAVALLLKGVVKFSNGVITEGDYSSTDINNETLQIAKQMIADVDGQELPFLNYWRGCVELLSGNKNESLFWFNNPSPNDQTLLYHLRLNREFGENFDLTKEYASLMDMINAQPDGVIDRIHPLYFYIDAKNLELSYDSNRLKFFKHFEKDMQIEEKAEFKHIIQKLSKC